MNDRIGDLLDDAADDTGRPLAFTPASLAARGRAVRRRRTAVVASLAAAAVVVVAAGVTLATRTDGRLGETDFAVRPTASDTATGPTSSPKPSPSAHVTPTGAANVRPDTLARCDAAGGRQAPHLVRDGWVVDAVVYDQDGATAVVLSPDGTRYAVCTLWEPGAPVQGDVLGAAAPLDTSPVPDPWPDPDGGIATYLLCGKEGPADCTKTLYEGVFPLREGVASVDVKAPDGTTHPAAVGAGAYVVRFDAPAGATSAPPVIATLRDAAGAVVARYDYNAAMR